MLISVYSFFISGQSLSWQKKMAIIGFACADKLSIVHSATEHTKKKKFRRKMSDFTETDFNQSTEDHLLINLHTTQINPIENMLCSSKHRHLLETNPNKQKIKEKNRKCRLYSLKQFQFILFLFRIHNFFYTKFHITPEAESQVKKL